jgi:hypothetical protein
MANKVTFEITSPDGKTSESTSDLESIILGSGDSANVKVTDPKVSNLHCMVKVAADGTLVVMDLGSAEGTKIANESVKEKAITSGEVLEIGASKVKVVFKNGNGAEAPKAEAKKDEPKSEKKGKDKKDKKNKSEAPRALAGTGKNATALFTEPLPAEAIPTETEKILQVALLWGDTLINVQHFGDGVPVTAARTPPRASTSSRPASATSSPSPRAAAAPRSSTFPARPASSSRPRATATSPRSS